MLLYRLIPINDRTLCLVVAVPAALNLLLKKTYGFSSFRVAGINKVAVFIFISDNDTLMEKQKDYLESN
jgi:hypothetical protein